MSLFTAPFLTGLAGAITIAAATPASAAAPVGVLTNLPISVATCEQASIQILPVGTEGIGTALQYDNLRISFVNRAALSATKVRFAVRTGTGTEIIDDKGSFASGARITHNFSPSLNGENFSDPANCAVQSVTFSDGSTWQPS